MARHNNKGRSKSGPPFVMLRYDIMDSQAWLSLMPVSRAVLMQISRRYNGQNNGLLGASVRDLASECRCTPKTVSGSIKALVERGFIEVAREGSFACKVKLAAEYRLKWLKCDKTGHGPDFSFKSYNLPKSSDKAT